MISIVTTAPRIDVRNGNVNDDMFVVVVVDRDGNGITAMIVDDRDGVCIVTMADDGLIAVHLIGDGIGSCKWEHTKCMEC